jgi:uncharacterized protein (TIGR03545 family)
VRWKGIIFLVVLIGIVVALSFLLTDRWLEKQLEKTGTAMVGAKVEIDRLDFSLFGLHMRWDSLQVTNPKNTMKNILTTGRTDFDMQFGPLLKKKVIVDNIQMINVTSGTDRTTDGKVEKKKKQQDDKPNFISKTVDRLEADIAAAPAWQLDDFSSKVNVDSILQFLNITSPDKIDSLQKNLANTYNQWDSTFSAVTWEEDLNFLKSRASAINVDELQTLDGLQAAYSTINLVNEKVDSLETFVTNTQQNFSNDIKSTQSQIGQVDNWIKDDFKNALAQAKLPSINKENIAQFIFGGKVVGQATQILGTINMVRGYAEKFKSDKPKKEKPPRFKGQTIYFTKQQALPNFWIKNIDLSGHTTRGLEIGGQLKHPVSDQKIIGQPTTFDIKGKRGDGANLDFIGEFNYLSEMPMEKFTMNMGALPLNNVKLSDSPMLPQKMNKGKGDIVASLQVGGESLSGDLSFVARQIDFDFGEQPSEKRLDKTVRKILQSASKIDLDVSLKSDDNNTKLGLDSNLDELFAKELQNIVGEEIQAAREKIEATVDEKVTKVKADFDEYVSTQTQTLEAQMQKYETMLNEQKALVNQKKKDLEARIEEEKEKAKKGVEDEAKKKIKGLLK